MSALPITPFFVTAAVLLAASLGLLVWGTLAVIRDESLTRASRMLLMLGVLGGISLSFVPVPLDFEYLNANTVRFQGVPVPMTMVVSYPERPFFMAAWGPVALMLNGLFGAGMAQLGLLRRRRVHERSGGSCE